MRALYQIKGFSSSARKSINATLDPALVDWHIEIPKDRDESWKSKIANSSHAEMIKAFIKWLRTPKNNRKRNTFMIVGPANAGKTKFKEMLKEIFPCIEYIGVHGCRFDVDYAIREGSMTIRPYHPLFILIDEGGSDQIWGSANYGNACLEDAKIWLEGKGKLL